MTRERRGREAGFTLIEVLIAVFISGLLMLMLASWLSAWARATTKMAVKARRQTAETDLRALYTAVVNAHAKAPGAFPSAGPWPPAIPLQGPLPWTRPNPGFDDLGWAPTRSPVWLQYRVESWSTGFLVSGEGDLDRDGGVELYRVWGDTGMYEGPLPVAP